MFRLVSILIEVMPQGSTDRFESPRALRSRGSLRASSLVSLASCGAYFAELAGALGGFRNDPSIPAASPR
jgi:hypothetical protein